MTVSGDGYTPAPETQSVSIVAGATSASVPVGYQIVTGRIDLTIAGLSEGATGSVRISGPGGYEAVATGSGVLTGLPPGNYEVTPGPVTHDGDVLTGAPATQLVLVTPGTAPTPVTATYSVSTGRLELAITGVPEGATPSVAVSGPGEFAATVGSTATLKGLEPGTYTITAPMLAQDNHGYAAAVTPATVAVVAGLTPAAATVAYAVATAVLTVQVAGLPASTPAAITVSGPAGTENLTETATLFGLLPGAHAIAAANVTVGTATYVPVPATQTANLAPSTTPVAATVTYARGTGSLSVSVTGLPSGVSGAVIVSGPGGYTANAAATAVLSGLDVGSYTIAAASISASGVAWVPTPTSQIATVSIGATAAATVTYAPLGGSIALNVSGLPGGTAASLAVSGPAGYSAAVTASTTLNGLAAGSYTVTAANVTVGPTTYTPAPVSQAVSVTSGATTAAAVAYSSAPPPPPPPPPSLNLTIDGMYLTQAAQRYDGSTPLVAGRDAYLRVFAKANQANASSPSVRVRFYSGATLIQTSTITAPTASVPTAVNEGTLSSSWNLLVPASLVQPNLRVLADVDPTNVVLESSDADNTFPVSGTPFAVDVRSLSTLQLRFVPVLQQVNGLQGNVTSGNTAQYLADVLKLLPIAGYNTDIRAVYTTTAPVLQSSNGNGAWGTVLSEVLALKSADGSTRYYYGVVQTSYSSGVAGIGYVGGGARTALGWDRLPSGSGVMAHELGHNMSRSHAPCGGVASPDPSYPYTGGQIGVWGLDLATLTLKAPTTNFDLMGYCNPDWVSDYNWAAMIQYRQSNPLYAPPIAAGPGGGAAAPGLLVWGRVTGAGAVLEPAFRVTAPASGTSSASGVRIEGLAIDGRVLFSSGLATVEAVDDVNAPEEHFAAVLPISAAVEAELAGLRLVTPRGTTVRMSAQAVAQRARQVFLQDPGATAVRRNAAQAEVRWDAATYPMALIRDAATGQILSFARGGRATIWSRATDLDVTFSDGALNRSSRLRP